MKKHARQLLVYSLAGILLSGVGATAAQAAPQNRDDRQQQEETKQQRSKVQRQQPQRSNVQRQEQPRSNVQRQQPQHSNVQRQEQPRTNFQRQEQPRVLDQRQRQEQRLDLPRPERQHLSVPGQRDHQWQQRNNITVNNYTARRHVYNDDRYRGSNWRDSGETFVHRQPWEWRSRNHIGRQFISDSRWDRNFPGLRSYRWYGAGFWYQGIEYRDLVLFYDDGDELVSIGFWNGGRFIMIRDDNRSYYNDDSFVLGYRSHNFQLQINL